MKEFYEFVIDQILTLNFDVSKFNLEYHNLAYQNALNLISKICFYWPDYAVYWFEEISSKVFSVLSNQKLVWSIASASSIAAGLLGSVC